MRHRRKIMPEATWNGAPDDRIRVLVECGSAGTPSLIASAIERDGYEVRVCHGPAEDGCALLVTGACALLDGADVVVNLLDDDEHGPEVLDRTLALRRPPAVVIDESTALEAGRLGDLEGATCASQPEVVPLPMTRSRLSAAITRAITASDGRPRADARSEPTRQTSETADAMR